MFEAPPIQIHRVPALKRVGKIGLLGNVDMLFGHFDHGVRRRAHGKVVQIVSMIRAWTALQCLGQRIYDQCDRRIANGVYTHLQSSIVNFVDLSNELRLSHVQIAAVVGLISIGL